MTDTDQREALWSSKREALFIGDRPNEAKWTMAVVDGGSESIELVALAWGYSPEGVSRRAALIAAAPALLASLVELLGPLELASAEMVAKGQALDEHGEAAFDRARAAIRAARDAQ